MDWDEGAESGPSSSFCTAGQLFSRSQQSSSSASKRKYEHAGSGSGTGGRSKRVHMDPQACMDFMASDDGAAALVDPTSIKKSSKDPHRGLYPRARPSKPRQNIDMGFVSASEMIASKSIHTPGRPHPHVVHDLQKPPLASASGSLADSQAPPKVNTLSNYFKKAETAIRVKSPEKLDRSLPKLPVDPEHIIDLTGEPSDSDKNVDHSKANEASQELDDFDIESFFPNRQKTKNSWKQILGTCNPKTLKSSSIRKQSKQSSSQLNKPKNPWLYETSTPTKSKSSSQHSSRTQDKYGLLGSGSYPKEEHPDYFSMLPLEVIENIFCQLPIMDLCLNCTLVCQYWSDIIGNDRFLPWKKNYHKLKHGDSDVIAHISSVMEENEMSNPGDFLLGLVRHMQTFKPVTASNMLDCLQKHSRYLWAEDFFKERLLECINENTKTPNPWSVITMLVLVSEKVSHITEILSVLLSSRSQCTAMEVLECFYCVASFLLAFKQHRPHHLWNGIHYRLYYALYLYENSFSSSGGELAAAVEGKTGQQSLLKYGSTESSTSLTHEQLRICNHNVEHEQAIRIIAFAGTGKTTTLVRYAQLRPNMKFLLVVYNKSVCEHSKERFPHNVTCKTGHSLGFQHVGRKYAAVKKLYGNLKVYDIAQNLPSRKGENLYVRAKFVMDTVNHFLSSAEDFITTAHVPTHRMDDNSVKTAISHTDRMNYVSDAEIIWEKMKDFNNKRLPITHDGYLKVYQLQKRLIYGYDCILIDEAQDLTPAVADILLRQRQAKILVGDPHQQIYAFRGAVNAMQQIDCTHTFYLTQSFRFGPEISFVASSCLELLKGETKKTLVGNGIEGSVGGEQIGQLAIIARCNFTLFAEAVKTCCYSDKKVKVAFVGGTDNFGFRMIMDIYALMIGQEQREKDGYDINNKFIARFNSLAELEKYAIKTSDVELHGKLKIVKTYNHNLPSLMSKINSKLVKIERVADILFTTAHKAKGLEFSTVLVTDDFNVSPMEATIHAFRPGGAMEDEANLLYVAVSRAKKALLLNKTLVRLLAAVGERYEYPVHSRSAQQQQQDGGELKCVLTDAEIKKPQALTLHKKPIKLGEGLELEGGFIGPLSIFQERPMLAAMLGPVEEKEEQK